MFLFAVANPPINVSVDASEEGSTVTVKWSLPRGGDEVTGYYVFYNHPNNVTTVKESADATSATFIEGNALQHVYSVSIQALSQHLPSIVVGPITVRGQYSFCPLCASLSQLIFAAPGPVQNVMVKREKQRKLNISWEEPEEPNDYDLKYTVTITKIISGIEQSSSNVHNTQQLTILSPVLGKNVLHIHVLILMFLQ